jgi:hypothetical protein
MAPLVCIFLVLGLVTEKLFPEEGCLEKIKNPIRKKIFK